MSSCSGAHGALLQTAIPRLLCFTRGGWVGSKSAIQYCVVVVTSAEEGGYVFGSVCLSVCLSVRRITRKLVNGF